MSVYTLQCHTVGRTRQLRAYAVVLEVQAHSIAESDHIIE